MAAPGSGSPLLLLQPLSVFLGLPVDQVNFVACLLLALLAACWFRLYLHPSHASPAVRHSVATFLGIYLAIFCYGWYTLHFFAQVTISYYVLLFANGKHVHIYSFIIAMGCLSLCQIKFFIFDYGIYSTDFTGPMMVMAQKITTLAYSVHDGIGRKDEDLSPEQRRYAVRVRPTLLQYYSYNFNFLSILTGPCCAYKDYLAFMEGRHLAPQQSGVGTAAAGPEEASLAACGGDSGKRPRCEPSPLSAVMYKLAVALVSLGLHLTVARGFPVNYNVDERFVQTEPLHFRLCYLFVSIQAARPKYYFAWSIADAINNAAGFGFNGYHKNGEARWDLISNLNIWNIETATSFKMFLDNWNMMTVRWLKYVCYDRVKTYPTVATFVLSAAWHGVYPGYYFTFLTGIIMSLSARAMRNNFRHYFLGSKTVKVAYDVVTWAATQLSICYTVAPFVMYGMKPALDFYRSMYYCLHVVTVVILLVLPIRARPPTPTVTASGPTNHTQARKTQ
ncbi:membrane-bound glycerophospholipid O-acyltransferase 1-like isoform X1 [Petromyzon marinus]|uniref:Lysophospholipid acyltransferase 1-like isoform X1 n=3 Tax=Petromyzon marinus TaxID=7757 RepID=A0AAJ7X1B2_PETMA|nr:lysophospholipid acyltransferase 1-like isoform X1 [Petromyzon marinus]